jgi:hypothetical protein
MMRNRAILLIAVVPLAAAAQIRPPTQDPRTPPRVPISLQFQRVRLLAASEPDGTTVDVKLRWVINEGWVPPGGFRLYRVVAGKKTRVYPPATPSTVKLAPQLAALRQSAVLPLAGDTKLFSETLARPPSSAGVFQARASKAQELVKKPQMNGRILKQSLISLPPVNTFFNNLKAPPTGPRMQSLAVPGEKVLDARRALIFSALASPSSAEVLGFGATDNAQAPGSTVAYELYEVGANGQDAADPVAILNNFKVGADPMPQAPTNVLATQVGEGEVELRWDRLSEADETKAGLALYDIRRFSALQGISPVQPTIGRTPTTTKDNGTVLTPQPIAIADLKTTTGFVEPFSFFADKAAGPGRTTYSVVLIDGFGRRSAPATVVIDIEDLRVPSAPSPISVELTGGGRNMAKVREAPNQPPIKVTWNADSDDSVRYLVYRKDTETDAAPVKLTANPIAGTPVGSRIRKTAKGSVSTPTRSFTDSTAETDRKYQYIIRSTYTFNSDHESSDAPTAVIDVPSFAKPSVPAGFKVDPFKPASGKNAELRSYGLNIGTFKGVDLTFGNPTGPVRPSGPTLPAGAGQINLPKALKPAVEIGGNFVVRWNAMPNMREPLYRVIRQVKGQPATSIEAGTSKATSFTDSLPRSQKVTYEYTVLCQSRWGVKGAKAAVIEVVAPATLPPASPAVLSVAPSSDGDGITVTVQPNADEDDIQTYRVYRKTLARAQPLRPTMGKIDRFRKTVNTTLPLTPAQDPANDTGYELAGQISPGAASLSLVDSAAKDATKKYFYKVEAVNRLNMRSERSEPIGAEVLKMSIAAPASFSATSASDGINLSWQGVVGSKGYVVKRAPASGGEFTQVSGVLTTTTFSDKTAVRGRRYRYVVVALDVFGNVSQPSQEAGPIKYPS